MKKYKGSILTCKKCGYENRVFLTNEEYDNDYERDCEKCGEEKPISCYDYFPIVEEV